MAEYILNILNGEGPRGVGHATGGDTSCSTRIENRETWVVLIISGFWVDGGEKNT